MKFLKKYKIYFISILLVIVSLASIVSIFYIYSQRKEPLQTFSEKNEEKLQASKILGEMINFDKSSDHELDRKNENSETYVLRDTQISEKQSESILATHESKDESQKSILKLEYQLNNIDEEYGFDIPAVQLFWGSKLIAQLQKDTEGSTKTIYLDLAFFEVESFDINQFHYDLTSTYDDTNEPKFLVKKVSLVNDDDLKIEEFSITNNQVEVLTKKSGSVEVSVETESIDHHQPVLVRIQKGSELIHPVKNHQYLDRFVYTQLQNDNLNIFQFAFYESEVPLTFDVSMCVSKNKCTKFKLKS